MKNETNNRIFMMIVFSLFFVYLYQIMFGIEHRRFERSFHMAYPITSEYKENAKPIVLFKLIQYNKDMLDVCNKVREYRSVVQSLPTNTDEEKYHQRKLNEMCDYLENVYLKELNSRLQDACRSAYFIGMQDELVKYGFMNSES